MRRSLLLIGFLLSLPVAAVLPPDSVRTRQKVVAWQLNNEERILPAARDTLLAGFQVFDPAYLYYRYPVKTGNIASPVTSACYPERPRPLDDFFLRYYKPYLFVPDRQVYFRARSPFTQLTYTSAGQKVNQEQILDVVHTQNVNKALNLGFFFNILSGEGQYSFQQQKKNSFTLFGSYVSGRYASFAHVSWNSIKQQENGGVRNVDDLETEKPKDVPMWLGYENKARSRVKNFNFQLLNYYAFGSFAGDTTSEADTSGMIPRLPQGWGRILYKLRYERTGRSYIDEYPRSGFYEHIYFDSLYTYDTTRFRKVENEVALELQSDPRRKFSIGSRFGLVNEFIKYAANGAWDTLYRHGDTLLTRMHENYHNNTAVFGRIYNDIAGRFSWEATGKIYLLGYKTGNTELTGELRQHFGRKGAADLRLFGHLFITRPVFRLNHFTSNHFVWNNDFHFTKDILAGASLRFPSRHAGISFQTSFLNQYVYFDTAALPAQYDGSIVLYSLELNKDFHLGKFSFLNDICLQQSGNDRVLPLPFFVVRHTSAFNQDIHFRKTGGLVRFQIGLDLYYQSRWYGYAYMPATGQFYLQRRKKIGDYPFADAYLNMKIQRLRFFFKVQHFTSPLLGPHYFTVVDYPMNQLFFKIGFSWTFYD